MLTRRQLLRRSAAGGAVLMSSGGLLTHPELAQARALRKFRTACPTPGGSWPVLDLRAGGATTLNLKQFTVTVHPDVGPTTVWGYEPAAGPAPGRSTYLGPTILAQRGNPVAVTYSNQLPTVPLFPADPALVPAGLVNSRINTHLHGARVLGGNDGNPFDAYSGGKPEAVPGTSETMTYPNQQGEALTWYHDHALGITRTNVYAGLAGGYLLTDPASGVSNVPTALDASAVPDPYAPGNIPLYIPLVIQDKTFNGRGQLTYPFPWAPEFFADNCLVNGRVFPFLQVQPRKYRFTFLNGSQSRFYNLGLTPPRGAVAPPITQIGVELGPINSPAPISSILISPGERADVIIEFAGLPIGSTVRLTDAALPAGVVSPTKPLGDCMEFRVVGPALPGPDPFAGDPVLPGWTTSSATPRPGSPSGTSKATLEEVLGRGGKPVMAVVNGTPFMKRNAAGAMTDVPSDPFSTETVPNGSTIDWLYLNLTADSHPFHTHLAHFEVISRQRFNAAAYLQALVATRGPAPAPTPVPPAYDPAGYPDPAVAGAPLGPVVSAPPQEKGPKEAVIANPGEITRIRLKVDLPTGATVPQRFVFHCHILEHEENEMMRPLLIT